jgi:hypothetical protein
MNSYALPPRRQGRRAADPIAYVTRRLSSLLAVAGGIVGIAAVGRLEAAGVPILVAVAIGLVLFVAVATLATNVVGRDIGGEEARPG